MTDFLEEFLKQYGGDVSRQLSSTLGIKQETALEMIPVVAPMILGGMKRQMEQHGGSDEQAQADQDIHKSSDNPPAKYPAVHHRSY